MLSAGGTAGPTMRLTRPPVLGCSHSVKASTPGSVQSRPWRGRRPRPRRPAGRRGPRRARAGRQRSAPAAGEERGRARPRRLGVADTTTAPSAASGAGAGAARSTSDTSVSSTPGSPERARSRASARAPPGRPRPRPAAARRRRRRAPTRADAQRLIDPCAARAARRRRRGARGPSPRGQAARAGGRRGFGALRVEHLAERGRDVAVSGGWASSSARTAFGSTNSAGPPPRRAARARRPALRRAGSRAPRTAKASVAWRVRVARCRGEEVHDRPQGERGRAPPAPPRPASRASSSSRHRAVAQRCRTRARTRAGASHWRGESSGGAPRSRRGERGRRLSHHLLGQEPLDRLDRDALEPGLPQQRDEVVLLLPDSVERMERISSRRSSSSSPSQERSRAARTPSRKRRKRASARGPSRRRRGSGRADQLERVHLEVERVPWESRKGEPCRGTPR